MTVSYELSFHDEVEDCLKDPSYLKELIVRATGVEAEKVSLTPKSLTRVSDPLEQQKKLLELWREFLQGRHTARSGYINPFVRSAWEYCIASGVSSKEIKKEVLTQEILSERMLRRAEMLDAAQPVTRFILDCVRMHVPKYALVISDEDGYLLSTYCSPEIDQKAEELYIIPGARYLEENVGNNGIGTALRLKEPMVLVGAEHFNELYHKWTAFSAPLYDANREIIGAIALAIPVSHTIYYFFNLIIEAGRNIENDMLQKYYRNKYRYKMGLYLELHRKFDLVFNKIDKGIVIVNNEFHVTECNDAALGMTGFSRNFVLGKKLKEIFPQNKDEDRVIHRTISEERNFHNFKVHIQGWEEELDIVIDTELLFDEKGKVLGAVVFFDRDRTSLPHSYSSALDCEVNKNMKSLGLRTHFYNTHKDLLAGDSIKKIDGADIVLQWKKIRHRWKLGKKDFAEQILGLNPNQYYRYENGISFPTLPKALLMAAKLNCLIEEIYEII